MVLDFLPPINSKIIKEIGEILGENPERVENNVKLLADWIKYQKHLPQNYDPIILLCYLRGCKQNLDKAKKKIETFFIVNNTQLDLFGNIIPTYKEDLSCYKYFNLAILPNLTPEGYRVTIFQTFEPSLYDNLILLRYSIMMIMMRAHHDLHQVAGEIAIFDGKYMTPQVISKLLTTTTMKALEVLKTAAPVILKQMYVITDLGVVCKAVNIIKPFLSEKLSKRIYILPSHDKLKEYIPEDCLPSDYGGNLKSIREYSEKVYESAHNSDLFEKLQMMKLNGPIPKEYSISFSTGDFGVDGSFRKLNLD